MTKQSQDRDGRATVKKDRIVADLRELIASGEIARGDRIRQSELAQRFNTSTTPVREALRQLEAEGLLVGSPHRGVRVGSADLEEIRGVYVARRLLEPFAMVQAATRVSQRDLRRATELNNEMGAARKEGGQSYLGDINREFHFLFYDRCGFQRVRDLIEQLWLGFPWDILQVISKRQGASILEHSQLLSALRTHDLEGVRQATEEHLRSSYLSLEAHLGGDGTDPFEEDEV